MKYMLTIIGAEGGMDDATPEQMKEELDRWEAYTQELADAGALIAGEALQESATATTVKVTESDERLVTDGPFAETKEQLGGFYLIECEDLDSALEWAKKIPAAALSSIEVRPVMDFSEFGYEAPDWSAPRRRSTSGRSAAGAEAS